jgi:DNA-binding CsgD family transcriptional regulator/tetratricopeptide (TPR) repeat protein
VFPGPFTLGAAEDVAGAEAGRAVLRLVDCSLLVPPREGHDGRRRYLMLETVRAFGAGRLAEAGEEHQAAAALARYGLQVAEQAAEDLETRDGELAAARWLDAEDATVHQALAWALDHDADTAPRLAIALAPWWLLRGRWATGCQLLAAAAECAAEASPEWSATQLWRGIMTAGTTVPTSLRHLTAVRDAYAGRTPAPLLARALAWRSGALANLGRLSEAAEDGNRALALARELGDRTGEAYALYWLGTAAVYVENVEEAVAWLRQAQRMDQAAIPGYIGRHNAIILARALAEIGEIGEAERYCADALAAARDAGALYDQGDALVSMALLDFYAGRFAAAAKRLKEGIELFGRTRANVLLLNCLELCGDLCVATKRWAEAVTIWAAEAAVRQAAWTEGQSQTDDSAPEEQEPGSGRDEARQALEPALVQAAEKRGAAMTAAVAAEYTLLLLDEVTEQRTVAPSLPHLSTRERELVTLVAQGRTNSQIAAQLSIGLATVRSALDRILAKTGSQRRADLTRLALQASLV